MKVRKRGEYILFSSAHIYTIQWRSDSQRYHKEIKIRGKEINCLSKKREEENKKRKEIRQKAVLSSVLSTRGRTSNNKLTDNDNHPRCLLHSLNIKKGVVGGGMVCP